MPPSKAATDRTRKRRRPLWKRLIRWVCWTGFLLVVALVLLALALPSITDSFLVKGLIRRLAADALNGGVVEIRTLRVSPLRGRLLLLKGLSLAPPDQPDQPLLSVDRVACHWSPLDLLGGKLAFTGLELSGVSVRLAQEDGEWNFASLGREGPIVLPDLTALGIPLAAEIAGGSVTGLTMDINFEDGQRAEIGPLSIDFQGSFDRALGGEAQAWVRAESIRASAVAPVQGTLEAGLTAHVSFVKKDLREAHLHGELSLLDARATLFGTPLPGSLTAEADLDAVLDLARLAAPQVSAGLRIPGVLDNRLSLSVTRPADDWQISADSVTTAHLDAFGRALGEALILLRDRSEAPPVRSFSLTGAAQVRTRVDGALSLVPTVRAQATVDNQIQGDGIGLALEVALPSADGGDLGVAAEVSGLDVQWRYVAGVALDETLAIRTRDDFAVSAASVRLSAGDLADVELRDISVSGIGADHLPDPLNVDLSVDAKVGALRLKMPDLGEVEFPAEVALDLHARNLTDPQARTVLVRDLRGSLGRIVPAFWLEGVVEGQGPEDLVVGGGAVVNVREVLAAAQGLAPALRSLLDGVGLDGWADGRFELAGAIPEPGTDRRLDVAFGAAASLPVVRFSPGGLEASAERVHARLTAGGAVGAGYGPLAVSGRIALEVGPVEVAAGPLDVGVEGAGFTGSAALSGEGLQDVWAQFSGEVRGAGAFLAPADEAGDPFALGPLDLRAGAEARANIGRGDLRIENIEFAVPGIARLRDAALSAEGFAARRLSARGTLDLPDFAAIRNLLPEGMTATLPQVAGRAVLQASVDGNVPAAGRLASQLREGMSIAQLRENVLASLRTGEPWPELRVFPLKRFYEQNIGLSACGSLALRDVSVRHTTLEGLAVDMEGLSADAECRLEDGDIEGEATLALPSVRLSALPSALEEFRLSGRFNLEGFDRLRLSDGRFSALNGVFTAGLDGEISGLSAIRDVPAPATLLTALDVSARAQCRLQPQVIGALEGWEGEGGAGADLAVELVGGSGLRVAAEGWLEDLAVARAGLFRVDGVNARVPFSKSWRIVAAEAAAEGDLLSDRVISDREGGAGEADVRAAVAAWRQKGIAPALDRLVKPAESLTVDCVSLLGRRIVEDIGVDIQVTPQGVLVPRASLKVLGGRVMGRAGGWRTAAGLELHIETEFDDLDTRMMLPAHLRDFRGDSSIAGNARGQIALRLPDMDGATASPALLKEVSGQLDVTHIGPEALDRALLFLDPDAQDPSIVQMRSRLALASPRSVQVDLRGGFVGIDMELQGLAGRLIGRYPVLPFSVAEALRSEFLARRLEAVSGLISAMALPMQAAGAEKIVLKADGSGAEFR